MSAAVDKLATMPDSWDWIVIGSGFGGAVSGLRLSEQGHKVLMLEKGRRFEPEDFPRSNWNLKRWLWAPRLGFRGLFQISMFRHITAFSGVGVGGGSLVYANTLPTPPPSFYTAKSWAHLASWEEELAPHYSTALHMLGATQTPFQTAPDRALQNLAKADGNPEAYRPTRVGVYFGEPGKEGEEVDDPFFNGKGPRRSGCTSCGGCMIGCRVGAKNSLDKNYLHFAEALGMKIQSDTKVVAVRPAEQGGYWVETKCKHRFHTHSVVFAGGVLGTLPLLLRMKQDPQGLPNLSDRLGTAVRTNSEALLGVTTMKKDLDLSKGIAIGSILQTDANSHLEPVRYPQGSGFFRLLMAPHAPGKSLGQRLLSGVKRFWKQPIRWMRVYWVSDWAKRTAILLYMRTEDSTLQLKLRGKRGLSSAHESGPAPTASMPEATALVDRMAKELDGVAGSLVTETVLGIPSTAHILGGCCMGTSAADGVIDANHRLFGYPDCLVVDGSAMSANPGVNPSLTITAMAERAMQKVDSDLC